MAFKWKRKPLPGIARGGDIIKKHNFKKDVKIQREKLESGILGEAYPNKVVVDVNVKPGSKQDLKVIAHEAQHVKDMQTGKAAFGDDWVRWEGKTYARKDGKIKYNGNWKPEGDKSFPWEKVAMKAEKDV